jgi:hypothetical protein
MNVYLVWLTEEPGNKWHVPAMSHQDAAVASLNRYEYAAEKRIIEVAVTLCELKGDQYPRVREVVPGYGGIHYFTRRVERTDRPTGGHAEETEERAEATP